MVIKMEDYRNLSRQSLFCRSTDAPRTPRPAISMEERASFAEHFVIEFAVALKEARNSDLPHAA
ncbi:hypothetical protein [Novosphingobium lentum]|uniref:hypothetical protein n=1 Tax=Novosphingobium lentum TaxID=145287 RepID=UPI0008372EC0|nr:hypothetical protein [Novosphingobium lentum]